MGKVLGSHEPFHCFREPALEARPTAVVLDPPRAGLSAQAAEALAATGATRIAYVSCDPASFARDLKVLIEHGFTLTRITPVDQFRWSPHVEVVGALER